MTQLQSDTIQTIQKINSLADNKQKIVFVSGNFNIVHPGHLRLLRFASECGDLLVVGVYDDQIGDALLPEDLRLEGVRANSWVDFAFILRDQPEDFIAALKPAIVVKGKEHENLENTELNAVSAYGGKLMFGSGDISFSSIDLLRQEYTRQDICHIERATDFMLRHGITDSGLIQAIRSIDGLKMMVIGDTIVDEYITCDPLGMSQEDPTIVVTPILKEKFVGGAGIVAAHARGLGAQVVFFSVVGQDATAEYARKQMSESAIEAFLLPDESRPTTLKQRFRANGKTLLRVNHLRQHPIGGELLKRMWHQIRERIDDCEIVIFSDFNYGCLPQELVNQVIAHCSERGIMMVADSQSSSQIGDVSRFENMKLLTPTEREARLAMRDFNSGLVVLAEDLRKKAKSKNIFMTLGKEGLLIHAEITEANRWLTDRLPAMNRSPKDIAGAGDSLLTCSAMLLAAGHDVWTAAYLGSVSAACQVSRLGNVPLSASELTREIVGTLTRPV